VQKGAVLRNQNKIVCGWFTTNRVSVPQDKTTERKGGFVDQPLKN
jgi:hypothetical protein